MRDFNKVLCETDLIVQFKMDPLPINHLKSFHLNLNRRFIRNNKETWVNTLFINGDVY